MNRSSVAMSFVIVAIFIVMTGVALVFYPEGARFQPLVIGLPAIALSLLQLALDLRARKADRARNMSPSWGRVREGGQESGGAGRLPDRDSTSPSLPPHLGQGRSNVERETPSSPSRELRMWGWFLGFIAGILLLGFWIAIPAFLVGFLRVEADAPWPNAVGLGTVGAGLLYAVFGWLLHTPLHDGFLLQWIRG